MRSRPCAAVCKRGLGAIAIAEAQPDDPHAIVQPQHLVFVMRLAANWIR